MTKSPLSRRVRRLALTCTIATAASLAAPPSAHPTLLAADPSSAAGSSSDSHVLDASLNDESDVPHARRGGIQIIVHQLKAAANAAEATPGGGDLNDSAAANGSPSHGSYDGGTHDSYPFIRPPQPTVAAVPPAADAGTAADGRSPLTSPSLDPAGLINWISATRTSDSFNQLLHSIGVEVCSKTNVQFDQSAEPFLAVETGREPWDKNLPAFRRWWSRQQPASHVHHSANAWHLGAADLPPIGKFTDTCAAEYAEYYGETATATHQDAWQEIAAARAEQAAFERLAFDEPADESDDSNFDVAAHVPVVDFDGVLPIGDHWIADPNFIVDDNFRLKAVIDQGDSARPDWNELDDESFRVVSGEDMLRRQLDALANDEPVDVAAASEPAVLTGDEQLAVDANSSARPKFVGSGPVILTLAEGYSSYDVSQSDVKLWSVLPINLEPFCIRGRSESETPTPLRKADDHQPQYVLAPVKTVPNGPVAATFDYERYGSPDCLLEDLRYRLELAVHDNRHLASEFAPVSIGRRIGGGVRSGTNAAASLIAKIGSAIPRAAPAPARPIEPAVKMVGEPTAGQKLIARAGATAQEPAATRADDDLRQASEKLDALISVARTLGQRFLR